MPADALYRRIRTVLFDLDGTFADTARDLARTLNLLRAEQGLTPLPFEHIRPFVSHGAAALVRLGFGVEVDDPIHGNLRERFLGIYAEHVFEETRLFAGIEELLVELESRAIYWGIVTNKPSRFTQPLLQGLGLAHRAACIVSGDTTAKRKPDPEPLLLACKQIGCTPAQCVYLGDAERDIEAGRRAGMATVAVRFGYLLPAAQPDQWGADYIIDYPLELLAWIDTQ